MTDRPDFVRSRVLASVTALLALGLAFCFFLSWLADAIGLAAIVGAFVILLLYRLIAGRRA